MLVMQSFDWNIRYSCNLENHLDLFLKHHLVLLDEIKTAPSFESNKQRL